MLGSFLGYPISLILPNLYLRDLIDSSKSSVFMISDKLTLNHNNSLDKYFLINFKQSRNYRLIYGQKT